MNRSLARTVKHISQVTMAWLVAYAIFGVTRFYGMQNISGDTQLWAVNPRAFIVQIILIAVITGVLVGSVDLILNRPRYQRAAYWKLVLAKILIDITIVAIVLTVLQANRVRLGIIDSSANYSFDEFLTNRSMHVFILFYALTSSLLGVFQQVDQKFGRGVLVEMLFGRYQKPQELERIFMFVDLKSSVQTAERLGHVKYSHMLQDCFYDLNTILGRYRARIYQYVGDQVVVHWRPSDGLTNNNCVRFFFAFLQRLEERQQHYLARYGAPPIFKAGAHMGEVAVAEVGLFKRSIAFHGDTVNTTSRIHDQCNAYGERLLVSQALLSKLPDVDSLKYRYLGDEILKGKHHSLELFAIQGIKESTPQLVEEMA